MSSRIGKKWVLILIPSPLNSETISSLNPFPQCKWRWLIPTSQGWEEKNKDAGESTCPEHSTTPNNINFLCFKFFYRRPTHQYITIHANSRRGGDWNQELLQLDQKRSDSWPSPVPPAYFQISLCFLVSRAEAQQRWINCKKVFL